MVLFFFYLLKLTCKGCNDGVVVVFIKDERINEFGVVVVVVLLFDEWFDADERFWIFV